MKKEKEKRKKKTIYNYSNKYFRKNGISKL